MEDNIRNLILAIVLSVAVLMVWQAFVLEPQKKTLPQTVEQTSETAPSKPKPTAGPAGPGQAASPDVPSVAGQEATRAGALAKSARVLIETPSLVGSINLKGGRIDDLTLRKFRVTVKPDSPNVVLLSPSGSPAPHRAYYAEYGWVASGDTPAKLPDKDTTWRQEGSGALTPDSPVTLVYDNGEGLIFRRTISVDENYMFTVTQSVENRSSQPVTLYPFGLVSRHGVPETKGFFILHEGPIGVLGDEGLQEIDYSDLLESQPAAKTFSATGGWIGITDKYWAAVLVPDQKSEFRARFVGTGEGAQARFQTDFVLVSGLTVAPGAKQESVSRLFAGAKQTDLVDSYEEDLGIEKFELLIDWGWFHFITKPLFYALDFFYRLVGNFGVSILIVTVLIKLVFFPLANKSYESMSKMKKLQPEMQRIRERFKTDRVRQQQELMNLYKKEKVNPMSGCLPILIQIPVFFALYKVLFVTIEMRHAPFFGWIQDLSAPDPTNLFTLFGLIPVDMPPFLHIGIWPLIMGVTMFVQMRLNPTPADPVQQKIFMWMPVFFTYLLATFPAGLVIYWTWNNILTIAQQWLIMSRQGVEVKLFENLGLDKLRSKLGVGGPGKN